MFKTKSKDFMFCLSCLKLFDGVVLCVSFSCFCSDKELLILFTFPRFCLIVIVVLLGSPSVASVTISKFSTFWMHLNSVNVFADYSTV